MQNIYELYAILEAEIAEREQKKEQLRTAILQNMIERGEEKIETAVGKFSISKRKSWTYPERVLEIGEKFKEAKAKAESTGEATFEETESLRFTQAKL